MNPKYFDLLLKVASLSHSRNVCVNGNIWQVQSRSLVYLFDWCIFVASIFWWHYSLLILRHRVSVGDSLKKRWFSESLEIWKYRNIFEGRKILKYTKKSQIGFIL